MNTQRTFTAARRIAVSWCLVGLAATSYAAPPPTVINGVPFDAEVTVRGSQLQLNGAGLRMAAIFKVYAGGLYLPKKASTLTEVMSQPGIKRWHVVFLRDMDGNDLGKQFAKSMEKGASKAEIGTMIPTIMRIGEMFSQKKRMVAGESYTLEWVPNDGTYVYFNGKLVSTEPLRDPVFFQVYMRLLLGDDPADASLKARVLGIPEPTLFTPG
jgi:hypothetical protein